MPPFNYFFQIIKVMKKSIALLHPLLKKMIKIDDMFFAEMFRLF